MSHFDLLARLERLQRLLEECRVPVATRVDPEASKGTLGIPLNAVLGRIERLSDEVRSSLECRHNGDALDALTARLLLEDYVAAVRELRTLANETGRSLDVAASTLEKGRRFIQKGSGRRP